MRITRQLLAEIYCGVSAHNPESYAQLKELFATLAKSYTKSAGGRIRWGFGDMEVGDIKLIPKPVANKCRMALHNWLVKQRTLRSTDNMPQFALTRLSDDGDYRLERTK